ncbi:MAG TPA: ABC transporter substrate-binding protein [Prolixibacteraceae bacterium]|nr:ABC transporter substrate-binding protein [Prolixibacteraceae bacterium]HPS13023.1 ABC transporter substrate-binding protein [Prolixibacteraceae bacterium]
MKQLKIAVLFFIFLAAFSCHQGVRKTTIGYVQITEDPVLNAAKAGFFKVLGDSGFIDGQSIRVIDNNAQGDLSMITAILQSFKSQGVDMVVTNSTPCMVAAAQTITAVPVVFTVAFGPEQVKMKSTPSNLYGVFDPLDAPEFVSMMMECVPNLKRVGLPYNNSEPNAEYSAGVFTAEFRKRGIEVVPASVQSVNDLVMVAQYLKGQHLDAVIVAADNTVYLGLNVLGKMAAETKIPLFVTDPLQVEKGAAIGMGVNYEKWGTLSGLKAIELLKGRTIQQHIEPITTTDLIINRKACDAQGLVLPQSILDRATRVIE